MKYEVDCTWGGSDITTEKMAAYIAELYEHAASQGGHVIASHELTVEGKDCVFFVSEYPDAIESSPTPPESR